MNVYFLRNVEYRTKEHGQGFHLEEHAKYFSKMGMQVVESASDAGVIFSFDFSPKIIVSALRARLKRQAVFVFCIGKLSEDQNWINRLAINILANRIHTLSRPFVRKFQIRSKVKFVATGIDLKIFKKGNEKRDKSRIISIGAVEPRKNYRLLLEIANVMPGLKFSVVGPVHDTVYYKQLQKIKPRNVTFLGSIKDRGKISKLCGKAYIMLHCSKYEMFSTAILEALATGTPVISFPHHNTKSNFGDTIDYAATREEFVEKITILMKNKKYYTRKSARGELFAKRFPLEKMLYENYRAIKECLRR